MEAERSLAKTETELAKTETETEENKSDSALKSKTVRLRPHHLLCTQGYSGKGYSDGFVAHMNQVVGYLRNDPNAKLQLVFTTDDICIACPRKLGEDSCKDQAKVKSFDNKLVRYFGLEEGRIYQYRTITEHIDRNMTERKLCDICDGCSWYPISACRAKICKQI